MGLYPTHGAGSFCTASGAGELVSTIGDERKTNPTLSNPDEDSFVKAQLEGLVPYPSYYRHMGPTNLMGPPPPPDLITPELGRRALEALGDDVAMIDMRSEKEFAGGHLRGSIGIPLRDDFGVWVGWVLPYQTPLALVANRDQDLEEARRQLLRIGFDDIRGVTLDLADWEGDLVAFRLVDTIEFAAAAGEGNQILDTRRMGHGGHRGQRPPIHARRGTEREY